MKIKRTALAMAIGLSVFFIPFSVADAAQASAADTVRICNVADCAETGGHYHNRVLYTTSSMYTACNLAGCDETGVHEHEGITYGTCHTPEACDVSGCNNTSVHTHDNCIYAGHSLDDGHCHSTTSAATSRGRHRGGHHGGRHH